MKNSFFKRPSLSGLLFALFALGLLGTFAWENIDAALSTFRAQCWVETPCDIDRVHTERHPHGRRRGRNADYSIDMRYTYEVEGRRYVGRRYNFWDSRYGKESARELRQELIENPAPTCYVNPDNPRESVFDRSLDSTTALVQLLLIVGIGGACIYGLLHSERRKDDRNPKGERQKHQHRSRPHQQNERPRYQNGRPRA